MCSRDPVSPLFDCVLWVQVCLVNYPRLVLYIKCCLFLVSFVWCYVLHVSPACLVLPLFWTIKNCYPEFYYLSTRSLPPHSCTLIEHRTDEKKKKNIVVCFPSVLLSGVPPWIPSTPYSVLDKEEEKIARGPYQTVPGHGLSCQIPGRRALHALWCQLGPQVQSAIVRRWLSRGFCRIGEWILARNRLPFTMCSEDDLASSNLDPDPSPPSPCECGKLKGISNWIYGLTCLPLLSEPSVSPVPTSGPGKAPVSMSSPERAIVPTYGPGRASVPEFSPKWASVPEPDLERAFVPEFGL